MKTLDDRVANLLALLGGSRPLFIDFRQSPHVADYAFTLRTTDGKYSVGIGQSKSTNWDRDVMQTASVFSFPALVDRSRTGSIWIVERWTMDAGVDIAALVEIAHAKALLVSSRVDGVIREQFRRSVDGRCLVNVALIRDASVIDEIAAVLGDGKPYWDGLAVSDLFVTMLAD